MTRRCVLGLLLLAIAPPSLAQTVRVQIEGAVKHPGAQQVAAGARGAEPLLAAQPTAEAYLPGGALYRERNLLAQTRLKAGLLYDLQALEKHGGPALASLARTLHDWLEQQPVTGRELEVPLDPRRLELDDTANRRVEAGDRVVYPTRPGVVRVMGALNRPCVLAHVPLQDAAAYARACQPSGAADSDRLFVIQPDGHVQPLGIGAWNRSPAQALAPGATVFVPLATRQVADVDPAFNAQFAQFLATQALPGIPTGEAP